MPSRTTLTTWDANRNHQNRRTADFTGKRSVWRLYHEEEVTVYDPQDVEFNAPARVNVAPMR